MKSTVKLQQVWKALVVFTIVILSSCKDDDPIPAEASMEFSSDQLVNGVFRGVIGSTDHRGVVEIYMEGDVPAGIKSFTVIRTYLNDAGPQTMVVKEFDDLINKKTFDDFVAYAVQSSDVSAETTLSAVIVDHRDRELTVELAAVEAYWGLDHTSSMVLDSDVEVGAADYTHFLVIKPAGNGPNGIPKIDPQSSSHSSVTAANEFNKVHVIYDFDPTLKGGAPIGSYLCSPNYASTGNPPLVAGFTVKHSTIFKAIPYNLLTAAEAAALENIDNNDVTLLIDLFERYQVGATTQRVTFNGAEGDAAFVLFKTHDGKIGLIKDHELSEGVEASITFDLWMML